MDKIIYRMLGITLLIGGIIIWFRPVYYSSLYDKTLDFSSIKFPFGGGLIILGAFFIWSSFRKKTIEADKKAKDEKKVLMCPKCIKPFYKKDCDDLKCPDCYGSLEELSGFYERHPELKKVEFNRAAIK